MTFLALLGIGCKIDIKTLLKLKHVEGKNLLTNIGEDVHFLVYDPCMNETMLNNK